MKMFVTRMGFNSKAVITGDITQIDLPGSKRSGLVEAMEILKQVDGITFCFFDESDVVRHHLVQRIIRAYDDQKRRSELQMSLDLEAARNGNGNGHVNGNGNGKAPEPVLEETEREYRYSTDEE
jgi:phosphate starvation-inducible PhoH-like protein